MPTLISGTGGSRFIIAAFVACMLVPALPPTGAQGANSSQLAELAVYGGRDREQLLATGAKKEGKVVWYTSLAGDSYKQIARAFEAKYGIPVEAYRGTTKDLTARVMAESQARRFLMDAVESTPPLLMLMRDLNLLMPYNSLQLSKYPAGSKETTGKGTVYWTTDRESYIGFAYNKNKLPPKAVPKSYDGLLSPALKGKIGFTTTDTGARTIGALLKFKGEEFVKKLAQQEITLHAVSGRALLDLVISGEVEASPTIFRNHAVVSMEQKAPVDWIPMDVVPANAGASALPAQAPHPHAAVLLVDFILSPAGQKILEDFEYGNAAKDYGFKRWYPESGLATAQYEKESNRWEKLLRELGRR
jgi:iron(III) transport system substrate-binding protein